jgi:rSAM/selenodomain-associated transferase 2
MFDWTHSKRSSQPSNCQSPERGLCLSVVIPALNEERAIESTLKAALAGLTTADEILVVDGGSDDKTTSIVASLGVRLIPAPRGRGNQMNCGAAAAKGDVLIFLHADTLLPAGFRASVLEAVGEGGAGWGRFDVAFDRGGVVLTLIAYMITWRSRLTKGATGDQAIFLTHALFDELGGFREPVLFEDVEFSRRLKRTGRMGIPAGKVVTSSRRWRDAGVWRTTFLMWGLKTAYLAGVSSARLQRYYQNLR